MNISIFLGSQKKKAARKIIPDAYQVALNKLGKEQFTSLLKRGIQIQQLGSLARG